MKVKNSNMGVNKATITIIIGSPLNMINMNSMKMGDPIIEPTMIRERTIMIKEGKSFSISCIHIFI